MFPYGVRIGSCVFLLITFFVGLIGNLLVCLAVRNSVSMRTPTNLILVNLAVADFLGCLVNMPIMCYTFWTDFQDKSIDALGEVHFVLTVFIGFPICCCHVLLCIDRHDAIKSPFQRRINKNRIKKISLVVWAVSFATGILTISLVLLVPTHWLTLREEKPHFIAGEILNGTGTFVILAILSMMIYSSCVVKRGINSHNNNMMSAMGRATIDREMRITKVTTVLITAFTVTCLPWVFFRLLYDINGHQDEISYAICYTFLFTSHAINPIVYAGLMRNFQRTMKQSLKYCLAKICCGMACTTGLGGRLEREQGEGTSVKGLQQSRNSLAAIQPLDLENLNT
ncbi:neuromedin-U receptor 2-like [Actinia tenebrosa]|uniref:Neuromedin-U receptor 2-like n=1 Tax=Actinia tenebrosa TaxID=6105 RepID=A0A6P8HTU4_ACTTE|nr:neuromedin-U receptor 2-like [Actinia tenebrosa]XP_031558852.1 neuromedin-U receptor 2-like [Actinia tenebrosa]XP_031558853.1 neuromedin-U receptor 2-like [Actinia tenebrosa]XP_031558855.1 neuromedin-U receptor 2-like [Actinia tenebrosa]XP_031558856.1 neuromedin-U receptor 2-like [Actinia tenebrosa]